MAADIVTIDVLFSHYTFPNFLDPIKRRAAEFERAHPGYKVNVSSSYFQTLPGEVAKAAEQGRAPTVASYYAGAAQLAMDTTRPDGTPLFTSVDRAIAGRTEILGVPVVNDYLPVTRGFYTIGGDLISVPVTLSTMHLYTNMTLLARAGITEIPSTWDEIDAACDAVTALDGGPSHGITWANDGKFFQQALTQQSGLLTDNDNGRSGRAMTIDLASPEMMAYVMWWYRLYEKGHFLYTGQLEDWAGTFKAFTGQQVAFRLSSSFDAPYMVQGGKDAGFEVGVSPTPRNRELSGGSWIGGDSLWLSAGLDPATQDGALAFIQHLNGPFGAADWHRSYGSVPVTRAAASLLDADGWFDEHPYHRVAIDQLDDTNGKPGAQAAVLGGFAQIQQAAMHAMDDVMVRGADPAERFASAAAQAQRLLDAYNTECPGNDSRPDHCWCVDS